jgi:flavodoxin
MAKAAVVYRSRTGTTRRLAEEIGAFLRDRGIEARVESVGDCDMAALAEVDYLLLGCWTNGLMVVLQHPDLPWLQFARDLPSLTRPRVGLFTTYKLLTGSMFAKMREPLTGRVPAVGLELKSRNGHLSEANRRALEAFVSRPPEVAPGS